jgi:selenocysteine lyase/cysteine desulfurase
MMESLLHGNIEAAAAALREGLPLLRSGVALNHAGIAPQPESESVAEFERRRAKMLPGAALEMTRGLKNRIRAGYARMLGVAPAEIAITRHTAEGVNTIAQGFPWKAGDRVLTVNVEYPSNVYPWWNLRDRGVEVVTVSEREGRVDLDEFLAAIDERRLPMIRPPFVGTDGMVSTPDYLEYRFEFRADASRFEYSTDNTLGLFGTAEALSRLEPLLGPGSGDALARRVFQLGDDLTALMESRGFRLYSSRAAGERSGIFSFLAPGDPAVYAARLRQQGVETAVRSSRLRISPHYYNNKEDLQRIALALSC